MVDSVLRAVERYDMLQNGDSVVVGLSGGADSVSLLHVLNSIKEKYNLTIYAAHLNHMLRGEEAERDEDFCKILCKKYNIPLYVRRADIRELSAERKVSEELCGRDERYAFFAELAHKLNAKIATAHTASDNAETLLFNLARGMSVMGAGGIPPKRGDIIRPLILCTRDDIERYCADNGLSYVTDSTNLGDEYTRNKIRHRVIPTLKELNPSFELAVLRFCESAALAAQCISSQAESLLRLAKTDYGWSADTLLRAAPAALTEALALLCERQADFTAEARHLELLTGILKSGGAVDLGEHTAVCKQGLLRFSPKTIKSMPCQLRFSGSFEFEYNERHIVVRLENSDEELKEYVLRTRQGGDRFTFAKRGVTKPLRKALNEKRVPDEARESLLLICDGSTVLWCEALGYSKQGEVLRETHKLSVIISKRGENHA